MLRASFYLIVSQNLIEFKFSVVNSQFPKTIIMLFIINQIIYITKIKDIWPHRMAEKTCNRQYISNKIYLPISSSIAFLSLEEKTP
jgi:hypothetical protein